MQILAQLLSARPGTQPGLSPPYQALFPPLLSPTLWERKGNVPALTDLFRAYISKGAAHIVATNSLQGVLGVFQKLLASKTTDMYAFKLLDSLFSHCQLTDLAPYVNTVWNLLLHRMQVTTYVNLLSTYTPCEYMPPCKYVCILMYIPVNIIYISVDIHPCYAGVDERYEDSSILPIFSPLAVSLCGQIRRSSHVRSIGSNRRRLAENDCHASVDSQPCFMCCR